MNSMIGVKLLKPDIETKIELIEKLNKMLDSLSQEEKRKFFCGNSCTKKFRLDVLRDNGFIHCGEGASKNVFTPSIESDWVIKIPQLYEKGYDNFVRRENCICVNSSYGKNTFNEYCAIEEFLSSIIEFRCLDNIFTYTELLKTDNASFPFYIVEKVHRHVSCTEESSHLSEKDYETFRKSYDNFSDDIDMYNSFAEKVFECYPNQFEDFLLFVKDFDINDLDFYNAGYDLAGNFRIFDYSGYWG